MGHAEKANAIEDRLIDFAVRMIKVADALPKSPVGKHVASQLLRAVLHPRPITPKRAGPKAMQTLSTN
jgi:hypothetical protein